VWDGVHARYEKAVGTYRIYIPSLRLVFVSRYMNFIEKQLHPIATNQDDEIEVEIRQLKDTEDNSLEENERKKS